MRVPCFVLLVKFRKLMVEGYVMGMRLLNPVIVLVLEVLGLYRQFGGETLLLRAVLNG